MEKVRPGAGREAGLGHVRFSLLEHGCAYGRRVTVWATDGQPQAMVAGGALLFDSFLLGVQEQAIRHQAETEIRE